MKEDDMVGWHHRLDGQEFEQAPGVGDGREAWHVAGFCGVAKSWTPLSDEQQRLKKQKQYCLCFLCLEKVPLP